ncbi:DeoR/GlpR family DNA-binding transcription regulator [Phyllobacterium sp. SB3]|uniref:DeoR/GlpR family DNA-binding transcription regulator n=1 Tax=Phyllobacterium sp. SB3 TaxID=3156073 RepID=UPI0032AE966B
MHDIADGKKERRQRDLLRRLEANSYLSLEDIVELYGVNAQTARRDIIALEQGGHARRLHGGMTIARSISLSTLQQRRVDNALAKEKIAQVTARLIPEDASLFLDTGTTCEAVAAALSGHARLRVLTYSLRSANILCNNADFVVAIPGGFVRPGDSGVYGENTPDFIKRFKFDYAIVSVSGVDTDGNMGDDEPGEVSTVRAAMAQSAKTILAVDHSKFGHTGMVQLGSVKDVDMIVCERMPPEEFHPIFSKNDLDVHIPTG